MNKIIIRIIAGASMFAAGITLTPCAHSAETAPSRFQNYITRQGSKLYDGDQVFRFVGANLPGIMLPYDWTLYLPERMNLPTPWEQEDAFKTLDQMNFRVVRTWNLPIRGPKEEPKPWHYVLGPGQFNEEPFKVLDSMFALANRYGVRVIFSLTADAGDYLGGVGTYAAHRGKKRAEFFTDPQLREDYKATLRQVILRTNSITGVRYCDDKAVLAWQFGNEMDHAPDAWHAEMGAYLKRLAPKQLVADTRHRPENPVFIDANIDMVTRHLYTSDGWSGVMKTQLAKITDKRPMFVGEFGPYIDGKGFTHGNLTGKMREFFDYVQSEPEIAGALLWSMYFHHEQGGYYWHQIMTFPAVWSYHWPGFPSADAQREIGLMQTLREVAFKIQNLPVPPMPIPGAPELLPFSDLPMFSWRGSAGASGYDIERASKAGGPWQVIATNVSDADIAYRPLFSDTTARAGQTWFYRVTARNVSGVSKPSNVVGPVKVKRICLADELQDFSRVHARSDGLTINNDFNALYAEYLFRAKGGAKEQLTYQVPAAMKSVKAVAFYAEDSTDLSFHVSADGKKFTGLELARRAKQLPPTPGGAAGKQRRTLVEYEGTVSAGQKYLKILWNGAAELDRVEIEHAGK